MYRGLDGAPVIARAVVVLRERVGKRNDDERSGIACGQAAQKTPPGRGAHLELARGFDSRNLVPLEGDRACVVGLELQLTAIQLHDLAGDPVAVGQCDYVGSLGPAVESEINTAPPT